MLNILQFSNSVMLFVKSLFEEQNCIKFYKEVSVNDLNFIKYYKYFTQIEFLFIEL